MSCPSPPGTRRTRSGRLYVTNTQESSHSESGEHRHRLGDLPGGLRTDRVLEAVVGELALQVLDKLAPDAMLQVVLFKLVALGVATEPRHRRTRQRYIVKVRGIKQCRWGGLGPHLQLRPMGETLIMPLRNSTKVPLRVERSRCRRKERASGRVPARSEPTKSAHRFLGILRLAM